MRSTCADIVAGLRSPVPLALLAMLVASGFAVPAHPSRQNSASRAPTVAIDRPRYQINLTLDVEHGSYTGSELVRWTNRGDRGTSVVFFHLYSNVRAEPQPPLPQNVNQSEAAPAPDEPRIEVTEVKSAAGDQPLYYVLDDQGTTLRVNLREAVLPGKTVEMALKFKGSVPEIDVEETGLVTHVIKQVSAAIQSEREVRRAREINFRSRAVMFLGTAFPVFVVHEGDEWRRKAESSVGDLVFAEAADYEVTIQAGGVSVFTSAPEVTKPDSKGARTFAAKGIRDFALIAGPGLKADQRVVGELTVRSIFFAEHERVGRRVLANAAEAARIFQERFGPLPFGLVSVVEAPLVAGLGSTEFACFDVIASAFYVDFESPACATCLSSSETSVPKSRIVWNGPWLT